MQHRFHLKFWGVRGSIPTPGLENLAYGGNTPCIEVRLPGGEILVIDGGTGIRQLGLQLVKASAGQPLNVHVLMTHFHWDHVQGIPFFAPLYSAANEVTFHSGRPASDLRDILQGQMTHPYFPVDFNLLAARRHFEQVHSDGLKFGSMSIRCFPMHHPQGAFGYRLESEHGVLVHASDREHGNVQLDRVLVEYAQGADVLVYDAQYTPEEYEQRRGWGHSTWLEGAKVAKEAGVKQLVLFHHDPGHDDEHVARLVE
ncbi:MAG: MBL fold metallo-hydrolase, partial [Acidobacteriota bacterium]|nr:MBL fold metallo-hydrolase [Acidobacteriota bacterium]